MGVVLPRGIEFVGDCRVSSAGALIRQSGQVRSARRLGVGEYEITFDGAVSLEECTVDTQRIAGDSRLVTFDLQQTSPTTIVVRAVGIV